MRKDDDAAGSGAPRTRATPASGDAVPSRWRPSLVGIVVAVLIALLLRIGLHDDVADEVAERLGSAESSSTQDADPAGARRRARARVTGADDAAAADASQSSDAESGDAVREDDAAWRFTVVADEDGSPIAGAVLARGEPSAQVTIGTTGPDGRCDVVADEPHALDRVQAAAAGRITRVAHVRPLVDRQYTFRLPSAGLVRGRVETPDGLVAPGIGVQLCSGHDTVWHETTTDAAGRFEFPAWEFGRCGYVVAGRASRAWRPTGVPLGTPATSAPFRLSAARSGIDLALRLDRPATLVLSAVGPDGEPAKGTVDFRVRTAMGGHSSRHAAPTREIPVEPGRMTVDASGPGGIADPVVLDVRSGERVERVFALREAAAISGTVVGADGRPCGGLEIRWEEAMSAGRPSAGFLPTTETEEDGSFVLGGLRPGRYVARVDAGLDARFFDVVAPAEDVVLRIGTFANVRFVVRAAGGEPFPRFAHIVWTYGRDPRFASMCDVVPTDGVFVAHVPPGRGMLHIELAGSPVLDREVTTIAGETLDAGTVDTPRWRTVTGRVVDADGQPAPTLTRVHAWIPGGRGRMWSASVPIVTRDGRFEIRARDAEGLVLFAEAPGSAASLVPVPRDGAQRDVEIRLVRGGTVRLHVVRGGAPARDAQWQCEPSAYGFAGIDADGTATARRAPGPVRLIVRGRDGFEVTRDVVVTEGATTDVDVTLPD